MCVYVCIRMDEKFSFKDMEMMIATASLEFNLKRNTNTGTKKKALYSKTLFRTKSWDSSFWESRFEGEKERLKPRIY